MTQKIRHIMMECPDPACAMRFPIVFPPEKGMQCPLCRAIPVPASDPYEELQVRSSEEHVNAPAIEVLLDNIRSIYNVGSMFRTADGSGVAHIHLCGMTPTPDHPRLAKTALGAQKSVPWSYSRNGLATARSLKEAGKNLWSLEGGPRSRPLSEAEAVCLLDERPLVLVVGNEISGIDPAILDLSDSICHIPMRGSKTSLNAGVAFGIALSMLCAAVEKRTDNSRLNFKNSFADTFTTE